MSDKRYTFDWFSPIVPTIEPFLRRYVDVPTQALEIGSFEGRSTCWFLDHVLTSPKSCITCIDTFEGGSDLAALDLSQTFANFVHNTLPYGDKVGILRKNSWEALCVCRSDSADFVFIDGSHEVWDVFYDAAQTFRIVKQNGLLIFDDYGWGMDKVSRPGKAIDFFLEAFDSKVKVLEKKYAVVVQKL